MEGIFLENEKEHRSAGFILSILIHLALLLILLINFLNYTPLEPGQKGIVITFGTVDGNEGDPLATTDEEEESDVKSELEEISKSSPTAPPKTPPLPEKPKVIAEKSPVVVDQKPISKPTPPQKTEAEKKAEEEAERKRAAEAEAQKKAAEKARRKQEMEEKKEKFGNLLSGKGEGESNQGDPDASKLENLSQGSGLVGGGLANREVVLEPNIQEKSQKAGTVVVKICVNSDGDVVEANYTQKGSTTTDAALVEVAERAAKQYKFTFSTITKQCGTVTIKFVVK
jgi:outer membrane biosynthesis protein TonB